jgi:hypothetical protein
MLGAQSASAVAPSSSTPTGSMVFPRLAAAAAPLADGRVLVVGGDECTYLCSDYLESAEIFDPAAGRFSRTGDMSLSRHGPIAAPLPDGRVLVAGGLTDDTSPVTFLQSAEIFDPDTGTFSPTGDMTVPRDYAAAAPLPDGRILVAGGYNSGGLLKSAEIFDPATGSYSPTGSMAQERYAAAAAPLPDGRVLVVGGTGNSSPFLQSAEIFDPASGSFSPVSSTTAASVSTAAVPLPDGRVLLEDGEVFDPATNSFSSAGIGSEVPVHAGGAVAAPLPDGRVLFAGGAIAPTGSVHSMVVGSAYLFTPGLSRELRGRTLIVNVAVAGTLSVADAGTGRVKLKSASATGGPGPITVRLGITKKAKRKLARKGKISATARLSFVPAPVKGECVTLTAPCFSSGYAITETPTLAFKAKKRKRR